MHQTSSLTAQRCVHKNGAFFSAVFLALSFNGSVYSSKLVHFTTNRKTRNCPHMYTHTHARARLNKIDPCAHRSIQCPKCMCQCDYVIAKEEKVLFRRCRRRCCWSDDRICSQPHKLVRCSVSFFFFSRVFRLPFVTLYFPSSAFTMYSTAVFSVVPFSTAVFMVRRANRASRFHERYVFTFSPDFISLSVFDCAHGFTCAPAYTPQVVASIRNILNMFFFFTSFFRLIIIRFHCMHKLLLYSRDC